MIERIIFINGQEKRVSGEPEVRLLDLLREGMGLTGTKEGCGEGECGACSILINSEVVNSCLFLLGQLNDGDRVETIEGLEKDGRLSVLQDCFVKRGAIQCGFCTPGMIMAAEALLRKNKKPSPEEVRESIAGNICRCTGYSKIVEAILEAADRR